MERLKFIIHYKRCYFSFFKPINIFKLSLNLGTTATINTLDIHIAENRETSIQIQSIIQNHLIKFVQNKNNITALTNEVTWESQIADHDLSKPMLKDFITSVLFLSSSFDLSKIKMLASIARPIERINHAIEDKVRTIQLNLTIAITIIIYARSAIQARKPDTLYIKTRKARISKNQIIQA